MKITVTDRKSFALNSQREYTDEGFLKVPGRVARTGIQEYLASELGFLDRSPNDIIRVMRPEDEVFKKESLDSYSGSDITDKHPIEMVGAENYKKVTVGVVSGSGVKDGDFVKANLIVKDKDAIKAIESGKVQLSAGYTSIYDTDIPEGADYEFIQRDIKINHVALVDRARAGAQARLFDNNPNKDNLMKIISLDNGRNVEVTDESSAALIQDSLDRLTKKVDDSAAELAKVSDESEKMKAKADKAEEDLEEEKKKSSDEAISQRIEDIVKATADGKKIAGDDFVADGVDIIEIKRKALGVARKATDWAEKSDIYIQAAFDGELERPTIVNNDATKQRQKLADDMNKSSGGGDSDPRQKSVDSMSGAYRKTIGEES